MRNVLTVFIASPSDLAAERKRTFQVVDEVNNVIKNIDWSIDLLGWEDTLPGFGRPQALINRDVERCDLFIGLLWRRWGTPPAQKSGFSSGFEEEFSIARNRREHNSSPEIWMFFKTVEPEQIADAGVHLKHVIKFRESLIASKAILFKEFENVDAWEKMLRSYLFQHVFDIAHSPSGAPEGPSERPALRTKNMSTEASSPEAPAAGRQVAMLAHSLEPAFETGDLSKIRTALNDAHEVTFLAVRSLLLSAALVAASGTSATLLPTHELNTLYRYRDRLRATDDELEVLFKTILAHGYDLKPGWYWFREFGVEKIAARLIVTALFRDDTGARAKSFEILRQAQVPIFRRVHHEVLERMLREIPSDLRDAAWAYLVDITGPEDLKLLRELAHGTWLESRVPWLQTWMETGRDLDDFLPKVPDPQLIPEPVKQLIRASIARLANESLQALKSMPVADLSEAAAAELKRRGTPMPAGEGALDTKLSDRTETDEEHYKRLSREDNASLRNSLDWYSSDGPPSYRLLVERGEIPRAVAWKDLSDRFQRIRNESDERKTKIAGSEVVAIYQSKFDEFKSFLTERFTAGALGALALEPTTEDVVVARRFLNNGPFRSAALRIVASKGTAMDVETLIDIARSTYGGDRKLALDGVLRLSGDRLETARSLVALEGRDMQLATLSLLRDQPDEDTLPFLEEFLSHEDGDLRVAAVGQLWKRVDRRRLEDMLRKYTDQGSYFYNVVTWLDRLIYAPAPILNYYETELDRKMEAMHY
jgi:hypothetical protein